MDNDQLFQMADGLTASLDARGHVEAAERLREGKGLLNGLTDGWALFLETIDAVLSSQGGRLGPSDIKVLRALRGAVRKRVHGKRF